MNIEERLFQICREIDNNNLTVEGILLMDRNADILFEKRWRQDYPRDIYSNTKSFTSAAVGMAIKDGLLNLSDKPYDFFYEYCKTEDLKYLDRITLKDCLTMSSGYAVPQLMYFDVKQGVGVDNYIEYLMNQSVTELPGKRYLYSTGDSIIASAMVEHVVNCSLLKYLYNKLFKNLNMDFPIWETDLSGHCCGGSGLLLSLTDMTKLGVLYLNEGVMNKRSYFVENWVKESTVKRFDIKTADDSWSSGYGYFWRIFPDGQTYRANGVFGQDTIVIPKIDRVIGMQCTEGTNYSGVKDIFNKFLFNDIDVV